MQKVINVLALASFAVSGAIVAGGAYVYLNKDAMIESAKERITKGCNRSNRRSTSWNVRCCYARDA